MGPTDTPLVRDIVLDLETLSTKTNAVVLAIGMVEINRHTGEVVNELYLELDPREQQRFGFHLDADTVGWWMGQSEEARKLFDSCFNGRTLAAALMDVSAFVLGPEAEDGDEAVPNPHVNVWGNGASFDNVILRTAYEVCGLRVPWAHWRDRDLRTLKDMYEATGGVPFVKTQPELAHHALSDARAQAQDVLRIYEALRGTHG